MSDNRGPERRKFLKYTTAGVIAAAIAAGGGYYALTAKGPTPTPTTTTTTTTPTTTTTTTTTTPTPTPTPTKQAVIVYNGESVSMYDEIVAKYLEVTNGRVKIEYTIIPYGDLITKIIASGGHGWDVTTHDTMGQIPMLAGGFMKTIPVEKIPRWDESRLGKYAHPENYLAPALAQQFAECLFPEGKRDFPHTVLNGVPIQSNWDTTAYNPEFLPYTEHGNQISIALGEEFNPEWKGHAATQDTPAVTFGMLINWLARSGQYTRKDESIPVDDPTEEEINYAGDYYLPYLKAGQFRTFWSDYGEAVNIFATREVYISDAWQPVCMDTRRAAVPCYYAFRSDGSWHWFIQHMYSQYTQVFDELCEFSNWCIAPWFTIWTSRNGYTGPTAYFDDIKQEGGSEYWGWMYGGLTTWKTIDDIIPEIWPDNKEFYTAETRIKNALFLPDRYNWSKGTGTPDPNGNLRDCGSVEDRDGNIGGLYWYPKLADLCVEIWSKVKASAGLV